AQTVLRYPIAELNALNNFDSGGVWVYPNADVLALSVREMQGTCDDVFKKVFLIDLYEAARTAMRKLLSYRPAAFEQRTWYETAQAWMEIWCRSTSIRGGTFRAAMAEKRLLKWPGEDKAPWPESTDATTGGGDGQTLAFTMNTLMLSGWTAKPVFGTVRDLFKFQAPWSVPDARETPYLCWPPAGPDEQYFGMPIWATIVFDRYRQQFGDAVFAQI